MGYRTALPPARADQRIIPPRARSREQDRRQPAAARYGVFVGGAPGLEKLQQLLAGAVIGPATGAAPDFHQMVDRLLPALIGIQRARKIEPGLMIQRIRSDLLLQ